MKRLALADALLAALVAATPAAAQDRDLCPSRPGLGTPACTVDPGHVLVETGLVDWTRDNGSDARTDTMTIGDTLVRIGLTDVLEAQVGWTPYGHQRVRDLATGVVDATGRAGDASIGAKLNLAHPDGSGFSAALAPSVSLPVGRSPIGAGDWGAAFLMPLSYALPKGFTLQATPEIDAAVDQDAHGRHLAWGTTLGLGIDLANAVDATLELQAIRDDDPSDRATRALAGVSFDWQPGKDWQLDAGANIGLNHAADTIALYAGVSRRF